MGSTIAGWTVLGIACAIWLAMGSLIDLYYKIRGNRR